MTTKTTLDAAVEHIQFAYPQIYHACHTRHARRRSSAAQVSMRDGAVLVHIGRDVPVTLSALADHLGLARSTVSEAVTRLERHGYVAKRDAGTRDRRHVGLVLTQKGIEAVRSTSVLEAARVRAVLSRLSRRELTGVVDGLMRLAAACRKES